MQWTLTWPVCCVEVWQTQICIQKGKRWWKRRITHTEGQTRGRRSSGALKESSSFLSSSSRMRVWQTFRLSINKTRPPMWPPTLSYICVPASCWVWTLSDYSDPFTEIPLAFDSTTTTRHVRTNQGKSSKTFSSQVIEPDWSLMINNTVELVRSLRLSCLLSAAVTAC